MAETKWTPGPRSGAMRVLRVLGEAEKPLTARELGTALFGDLFDARARSASAAQSSWELIRRGLAERTLKRRELYAYAITDAGRAVLTKARGEQP